jgi:predicted ABC-type ATPase
MRKYLLLIAGINGAGKTTLREKYNIDTFVVDIDSLAKLNNADYKKAVKLGYKSINNYLEIGMSFGQETTLTGHAIINTIKRAKSLNYRIKLIYVGLDSVDLAIDRVADRVAKGGHDIPLEDIKRRYSKSLKAVVDNIDLFDDITFYDNSTDRHIHVATYADRQLYRVADCNCGWLEYIQKNIT